MKNYPRVVIGILTWDQKQDTLECLDSVYKLEYPNFEVVVIDNGSSDNTSEAVNSKFPQAKVIRNTHNLGCAEGVNCEIRYALLKDSDYLFILANDSVIDKNALMELVIMAESDKKIGIVSPKIYYYDRPDVIWSAGGGSFDWIKGKFYDHVQNVVDRGEFDKYREFDFSPGGFSFVRTEVLKKGCFLDNRYFIFFDDSEWNLRVRKLGYKLAYCSSAKAWHKTSSSLGMESASFYYYRVRNRLLFVKDNAPRFKRYLFYCYFCYDFSFNLLATLYLSGKKEQARAAIVGLLDFLRSNFGKRQLSSELLSQPLSLTFCKRARDFLKVASKDLIRRQVFFFKRIFGLRVKILLLFEWNLGDEIMTIPVYQAFKNKFPRSLLAVRVNFPELLIGNPYVDLVNPTSGCFDKIINIKGEDRKRNRLDYLSEKLGLKIINRIPRVYDDGAVLNQEIPEKLNRAQAIVAVSCGANWKSRQWSLEKFKQVAEILIQQYKVEVVELGKNCAGLGMGLNLVDKTSIRQAVGILRKSTVFIGNDSGLMHLSLAVGTPTIGLFGPLNPDCLLAYPGEKFVAIKAGVKCQGCWSGGRMLYPDNCPKLIPVCMDSIKVEDVVRAAAGFIKSYKPDSGKN